MITAKCFVRAKLIKLDQIRNEMFNTAIDYQIFPPSFISLPLSFAESFRRNNAEHKKKDKPLFYINVEYMCDKSL